MLRFPPYICSSVLCSTFSPNKESTAQSLLHSLEEECAMRLHDFIHLPEKKKVSLLYEQGVYIGKRKHGKTVVILYQLDGFYAEVYYRTYRRVIDRISCFSDTARLDPYLTDIDVEYLV